MSGKSASSMSASSKKPTSPAKGAKAPPAKPSSVATTEFADGFSTDIHQTSSDLAEAPIAFFTEEGNPLAAATSALDASTDSSTNLLANQTNQQPSPPHQLSFAAVAATGAGATKSSAAINTTSSKFFEPITLKRDVIDALRSPHIFGPTFADYSIERVPSVLSEEWTGRTVACYAMQHYQTVEALIADERAALRACVLKSTTIIFIRQLGVKPLIVMTGLSPKQSIAGAASARTTYVDLTSGPATQMLAAVDVGIVIPVDTQLVTCPADVKAKVLHPNHVSTRGDFAYTEVAGDEADKILRLHPHQAVAIPMTCITTDAHARAAVTIKFKYNTAYSQVFAAAKELKNEWHVYPRTDAIRAVRKDGARITQDMCDALGGMRDGLVKLVIPDMRILKPRTPEEELIKKARQAERDASSDLIVVKSTGLAPLTISVLTALASKWQGAIMKGDAQSALMRVAKGMVPTGGVRIGDYAVATLLHESNNKKSATADEETGGDPHESHAAAGVDPPVPANQPVTEQINAENVGNVENVLDPGIVQHVVVQHENQANQRGSLETHVASSSPAT